MAKITNDFKELPEMTLPRPYYVMVDQGEGLYAIDREFKFSMRRLYSGIEDKAEATELMRMLNKHARKELSTMGIK